MPPVPGQGTAAGHLPGLHCGDVAGDVRGQPVRSRPEAPLARSGSTARTIDPQGRITALPCFLARLALDERVEARGALASRASSDRTHGVRLLLDLLLEDPARRPRRGGRGKGGHGPAARTRGAPLRRPSRQRQGLSLVPVLLRLPALHRRSNTASSSWVRRLRSIRISIAVGTRSPWSQPLTRLSAGMSSMNGDGRAVPAR